MAITHLKLPDIKSRLGVDFKKSEDVLGPLHLAKSPDNAPINYQIRIRETSPEPSTEIMLPVENARGDLDDLLKQLRISRSDLFWTHPRAGGTLRRRVVDVLLANLDEHEPLVQILVGPRQVGKTTAVEHLKKEWGANSHYASADSVVDEHGPWLEKQWQEALSQGEGTLLILDEIQKVENWTELVKALWDKTRKRGLRVVLLGSTSLNHCLTHSGRESLAGRFFPIYVPHWSYPETKEAFGSSIEEFSLFGGYPKAMEFANDREKWIEYIGGSIINPIIDVDIFLQGNFKKIENLRRAFRVLCQEANVEINYTKLLQEIQQSGNTDIVKRYLEGYYDSFLLSQISLIDDNGNEDSRGTSKIMINCPAVFTFGRSSFEGVKKDRVRFHQAVASELKRIPNNSFGYWQKSEDTGMTYFIRTTDNKVFGIYIDQDGSRWSATKSYDQFRRTFKGARIVTVNPDNYDDLLEGQRAFLETAAI